MICPNCERDLGVETIYDYYRNKGYSETSAMMFCGKDKTRLCNEAEIFYKDIQITIYKCLYCNKVWNDSKNNNKDKKDENKWVHINLKELL